MNNEKQPCGVRNPGDLEVKSSYILQLIKECIDYNSEIKSQLSLLKTDNEVEKTNALNDAYDCSLYGRLCESEDLLTKLRNRLSDNHAKLNSLL